MKSKLFFAIMAISDLVHIRIFLENNYYVIFLNRQELKVGEKVYKLDS